MIPPGAREIRDPEAEVNRLAEQRKRGEDVSKVLLSDSVVMVPDPDKPGMELAVRVRVTAERWVPVRAEISARLRDAVAASIGGAAGV